MSYMIIAHVNIIHTSKYVYCTGYITLAGDSNVQFISSIHQGFFYYFHAVLVSINKNNFVNCLTLQSISIYRDIFYDKKFTNITHTLTQLLISIYAGQFTNVFVLHNV